MNLYWVYILASQSRGTLYIGVTNNILGRVEQHRAGKGSVFARRYRVAMLVYFEEFNDINAAIRREKALKHYVRAWSQFDRTVKSTLGRPLSRPACSIWIEIGAIGG